MPLAFSVLVLWRTQYADEYENEKYPCLLSGLSQLADFVSKLNGVDHWSTPFIALLFIP